MKGSLTQLPKINPKEHMLFPETRGNSEQVKTKTAPPTPSLTIPLPPPTLLQASKLCAFYSTNQAMKGHGCVFMVSASLDAIYMHTGVAFCEMLVFWFASGLD